MRIRYITYFILLLLSAFSIFSCSEDTPNGISNSQIIVTHLNLKPLDQQTDGHYEAWISFEENLDHDESAFNSIGKFNINLNGDIVDLNGNLMIFNFKKLPINLNNAEDVLISVEPPNDIDTLPTTKLLNGLANISNNTLTSDLKIEGTDALGQVGAVLYNAAAKFILNTPTSAIDTDYYKGIWFCDTNQTTTLNNFLKIPDTLGWTYEAWVVDTATTPYFYHSLGRFLNPDSADSDGAGIYRGVSAPYVNPGQDWISNLSPITDLRIGKYQVWITLEPAYEVALQTPFYLRIFTCSAIPANA